MWLLAFLGVTVVGNMGTVPHPLAEGVPNCINHIFFFLISGALTSMCYQLLMSYCRGNYWFYFVEC